MKPEHTEDPPSSTRAKWPLTFEQGMLLVNLVATAAVGIIIAFYTSQTQANVSREVVAFQATATANLQNQQQLFEQQRDSTRLVFGESCLYSRDCEQVVSIRNSGTVPSRNVDAYVELTDVSQEWIPHINGEGLLRVECEPITVQCEIHEVSSSNGKAHRHDTGLIYRISVSDLSPDEVLEIAVMREDVEIESKTKVVTQPVRLKFFRISDPDVTDSASFLRDLNSYLVRQYGLGRIKVSASCENCTGKQIETDFPIPSFVDWSLKTDLGISTEDGTEMAAQLSFSVESDKPNGIAPFGYLDLVIYPSTTSSSTYDIRGEVNRSWP